MKKLIASLALLLTLATPLWAEHIDLATAILDVDASGRQKVTEEYRISGVGSSIRRGLERFIPTEWVNAAGYPVDLDFQAYSATIDGQPTDLKIYQEGHGLILRSGRADTLLSPGHHSFGYEWQLEGGTLDWGDYQEVSWNGLGTDWDWSVDRVLLVARFPEGVEPTEGRLFLGTWGSTYELDFDKYVIHQEGQWFVDLDLSSEPAGTGVTLAFKFPAGSFALPALPWWQRLSPKVLTSLISVLMVVLACLWRFLTPSASAKPVVPRWDLQASPALVLSDLNGAVDGLKGLSVNLLSLAAKGALSLKVEEKNYALAQGPGLTSDLFDDEKALLDSLELSEQYRSLKTQGEALRQGQETIEAYQGMHRAGYFKSLPSRFLLALVLLALGVGGIVLLQIPSMGMILSAVMVASLLILLTTRRLSEKGADRRAYAQGLKLYLSMAEKDRLNLLNPPELTPEHFELMMPYAFALGVEQQWSEAFAAALEKMAVRPELSPLAHQWMNPHGLAFYRPSLIAPALARSFPRPKNYGSIGGGKGGSFGGGGFSGGGVGGGGGRGW